MLNLKLKAEANMDIAEVTPIKCVDRIRVPACFISGTMDVIVPHEQTLALYNKFKGPKSMKAIIAGHNGFRPK